MMRDGIRLLLKEPAEADQGKPNLTRREKECLHLVAEGKSSWSIGVILGISENTVNFHIKNVCRKMNTNCRVGAIKKAIRWNLIAS